MRKLFFILFFISFSTNGQTTKKVGFLGNSYTYVNDLPQLISDLATADGNTLIIGQNTPGGYTLMGHSTNPTSLGVISSDTWDYVVLQDQSQLPSFPWSQVQTDVLPYAEVLVDSIRSANDCAVPLFYNTWGRLNGDPQWDSINTFDKMNQRLYNAYGYMADKHSGKRAPIGIGFNHVQDDISSPLALAALYSGDGSHPSIYGSYLAACIFYEIIFEESSQGNTFVPGGISPTEATYLQDVAFHILNDVDSVDVDFTQPLANFVFSNTGNDFTFTNQSIHSFEWLWDFGDGNTSTDQDPAHTYATGGIYDVTLTATYCGNSHDTTFQINTSIGIEDFEKTFNLYPNPTNGVFTIDYSGEEQEAQLFTMDGRLLNTVLLNEPLSPLLESGSYLIRIGTRTEILIIER